MAKSHRFGSKQRSGTSRSAYFANRKNGVAARNKREKIEKNEAKIEKAKKAAEESRLMKEILAEQRLQRKNGVVGSESVLAT